MGIGGPGHGPVAGTCNSVVNFKRSSARCWQAFPRKSDAPRVPCIVARLNASSCNEDLQSINQGSPLSALGCSFSPDDDRLIVCTSVIKRQLVHQDGVQHLALSNAAPTAGFITLWLIKKGHKEKDGGYAYESCSHSIFTYSPQPCCKFSPDGQLLTAILNSGKNSLVIMKREDTEQAGQTGDDESDDDVTNTSDCVDLNCDSSADEDDEVWFSEFAYTPRGQWGSTFCGRVVCAVHSRCCSKLVSVSKVSLSLYRDRDVHEICMWDVLKDNRIKCLWGISCQIICPSFSDSVTNCKFSTDSDIIGISSNRGHCIFIESISGQCCAIVSQNDSTDILNSPCDFDFDPLQKGVVAIAWRYGPLKMFLLNKGETLCLFDYNLEMEHLLSSCVSFAPDGLLLAAGTVNGKVLLFDTNTGKLCRCLDASEEIPDVLSQAVFQVSFAKSCQELAAAYNDGQIRIWQLQRVLNLQHICRLAILSQTPTNKVSSLLLPKNLESFLLYSQI